MLKSPPIKKGMMHIWYKKKTFEKKKDCPLSRFGSFEHVKAFFIHVKF
jgi:hypothetical protein